jgi:hypothetical protein
MAAVTAGFVELAAIANTWHEAGYTYVLLGRGDIGLLRLVIDRHRLEHDEMD